MSESTSKPPKSIWNQRMPCPFLIKDQSSEFENDKNLNGTSPRPKPKGHPLLYNSLQSEMIFHSYTILSLVVKFSPLSFCKQNQVPIMELVKVESIFIHESLS